jgi:hypothetical protein
VFKFIDRPQRQGSGELHAGNFPFRSQYKMIEQQLLPPSRPSCRVSGVSPYKPHHNRIQLKGLTPPISSYAAKAVILKSFVTRAMVRRPFTGIIE